MKKFWPLLILLLCAPIAVAGAAFRGVDKTPEGGYSLRFSTGDITLPIMGRAPAGGLQLNTSGSIAQSLLAYGPASFSTGAGFATTVAVGINSTHAFTGSSDIVPYFSNNISPSDTTTTVRAQYAGQWNTGNIWGIGVDGTTTPSIAIGSVAPGTGKMATAYLSLASGSSPAGLATFNGGVKLPTSGGTPSTLDFYQDSGTSTVSILASGTNWTGVTYTSQTLSWVRVGKMVTVTLNLVYTATTGTPTGSVQISGLPFAVKSTSNGYHELTCMLHNFTWPVGGYTQVTGEVSPGATVIALAATGSGLGETSFLATANSSSTTRQAICSGTYQTN